jgi:amino-acid N-acetyltransferase
MSPVTLRCATAGDQDAICALVKRERLNPTGLHWPNFIVAADERGIVGAVQLRRHRDGARELGSLVVAPGARGQGLATRLIDTLLATQRVPVQMITGATHAGHYRRWGFEPIEPHRVPRSVRLNYRIGRLARLISLMRGQPPRRLVILQRPAPGAQPSG